MSRLSIAVLGSFQVTLDGRVITGFRSDKARALLAYLAVQSDQPHRREKLAALFWPDCTAEGARNNLRQTLYALRQALSLSDSDPACLLVSQHDIQFNAASDHWLDVAAFNILLEPCPLHAGKPVGICPACAENLREAVRLYRGDFLTGLSVVDAEAFEEWVRSRQEQYHRLALDTMQRLTDWYERRHEYQVAESYASRQLEMEPWREEAHCSLMRVLALSGQRSAALHQYDLCRQALDTALGVEPAPGMVSLYLQILSQTLDREEAALSNPYKGLRSFGETDAAEFFGREAYIDRLMLAVRRQPIVALVGASGSGKSSIIGAGLIPRLILHPGATEASGWVVIRFRPSGLPFERLAEAILAASHYTPSAVDQQPSVARLAASLASREVRLADALVHVLRCNPDARRVLLVADQFEELFALAPDPHTRSDFIEVLLTPAQSGEDASGPGLQCLLIGLRVDFMGQALAYRRLADALQENTLMLGEMSQHEMVAAIEEPARGLGVRFEPGLVARLLDDVGQTAGRLPLMEFALTSLWDHRTDGVLTHAEYDRIGGVQGALAHYAEDIYSALREDEKLQARNVFLQLVRPGHQTDDTRKVVFRSELGEKDWATAQRLADARLAVTGRDPMGRETVEIVHEALITGWQRLHAWLDADRAFRLWQEGLRTVCAQWEATGRDAGGLLRGAPLVVAEGWLASRASDLDAATSEFVTASIAQREEEFQSEETRRRHELDQARALAAAETGARRRMRGLSLVLAVLVLVASIAAAAAVRGGMIAQDYANRALAAQATAEAERGQTITERNRAETQARLALSHQLAAQSSALLASEPDLALLLGLEAGARTSDPLDEGRIMLDLQINPYLDRFLHGAPVPIYLAGFSADGRRLSTLASDGVITRWDVQAGRTIGDPLTSSTVAGVAVGMSPDGNLGALARGSSISLWNLQTGLAAGSPLIAASAEVRILAFSGDDKILVSGDKSGRILRWDLTTGISATVPFTDTGNAVWALSPGGDRLALTEDPGQAEFAPIVIRDLVTGAIVGPRMLGHKASDGIHGLTFSRDGRMLASSSFDKTTILWDAATGKPLHPPLQGHTARALVAAFSPDGRLLATGGTDDLVLLWDVASGTQVGAALQGHSNWVRALAWSSDGRTLASSSADGTTILWDIGRKQQLRGFTSKLHGVVFSPDGRTLIAGSLDQAVRRFDLASGAQIGTPYAGDGHSVLNLAQSPDAQTLAIASASGDVTLLDAASLRPIGSPLQGHTAPVMTATFSPDGRTLATGSFDHSVILWDIASRQRLGAPLNGHTNWVLSLAFSPDGRVLASGSADSTIILWDVASQTALGQPLQKHTNWVTGLAFSPDGRQLASASADNSVLIWDVQTHEPNGQPLLGHGTQVWAVSFDPADRGRTLITAGANGSIISWDMATRVPTGPPLLGNVEMETMAVSPDGNSVALGGFDEIASIWLLDRRPWHERACEIANRNLTPAEWQRYLYEAPYRKTCAALP